MRTLRQSIGPSGAARIAVLVCLVAAVFASCGGDTGVTSTPFQANLPSWIESVRPLPESVSTANTVIEVAHSIPDTEHVIRLIVDGVDVTAAATEETAGITIYRPLEPGPHTATLERIWLPGAGQESVVLDTYTWTFETL
jgi:hypothetical protein